MKMKITLAMLAVAGLFVTGCQTDPLIIERHYTENTQLVEPVVRPVASAHGAVVGQINGPKPRRIVSIEEQVESEQVILR